MVKDLLGTSNGKAIRFSESDINRWNAGVRILVEDGEQAIGMAIVNTDSDEIVIVTVIMENELTLMLEFKWEEGVKAINMTEKNGKMVSLSTVRGDEDLIVVTDKGMVIRTHLDQILTVGRDTQGVSVIRLNEGHKAATIAVVPREDDEEDEFDDEYRQELELDYDYTFLDEEEDND